MKIEALKLNIHIDQKKAKRVGRVLRKKLFWLKIRIKIKDFFKKKQSVNSNRKINCDHLQPYTCDEYKGCFECPEYKK